MKKYLLIILVLICLLNIRTNAQWLQIGPPQSTVYSLIKSGPNILAGTEYYGAYISTNDGLTWNTTSLNDVDVYSFAVYGSTVFAGTSNGVFISSNSGFNWTQSTLIGRYIYSLAVNGSYVFAGVYGFGDFGVYVSANNGQNWTQTSINTGVIHALVVQGSNIIAGSSAGIYVSSNNGLAWSFSSFNGNEVLSLAVSGSNIFAGTINSGIYLSTNSGQIWNQTSMHLRYIYSIAVNGSNIFAGSLDSGTFISQNNGLNWVKKNEGMGNIAVTSLTINNNFIFAGTLSHFTYKRNISELVKINNFTTVIPQKTMLSQNYPNPFNPTTNIKFDLPKSGFVKLTIYDALGREVTTLVNSEMKAGSYNADWDASSYSSGIYFYKLVVGDNTNNGSFVETKKMVLIK